MAEETKTELAETVSASADMEVENAKSDDNGADSAANGESKRPREEGTETEEKDSNSKKQKVEKSVEEERLEKTEEGAEGKGEGEGEAEEAGPVSLGPKSFASTVEMFDYFFGLLRYWPPNVDINEYEHMVLLDLLKKGHSEPDKKIGGGIRAFQVRYHPMWKSRCYFLIRDDEVDDFSFRKCVDHILPLPEEMKGKSDVNRALGGGGGGKGRGGGGGRRRGRGRGCGRGGKARY